MSQATNLIYLLSVKLEFINLKARLRNFDNEFISMTNSFIDNFVEMKKSINESNICYSISNIIADNLVRFIEAFESNSYELIASELLPKISTDFEALRHLYYKSDKQRLIIFGANTLSSLIPNIIDPNNAEIIAYIETNPEYIGKFLNNIEIHSIDILSYCDYDYIIFTSPECEKYLTDKKISNNKIIDYYKYWCAEFASPEFLINYFKFIDSKKDYEGIITGISYAVYGIDTNLMSKKMYNLAAAGQDLFYDFEMLKYALSFTELKKTIKYAIISLCYYSFEYDLSKSSSNIRSIFYNHITNTMHNYQHSSYFMQFSEDFNEKTQAVFRKDHFKYMFQNFKSYHENAIISNGQKIFDRSLLSSEEKASEIEKCKKDFNKNYPDTVKENKIIFRQYLDFLKANDIKPIVVVCPATELYHEVVSERIKEEFLRIVSDFREEYSFQFIDCFYNDKFTDSDFFDPSHLNFNGAKKFTEILESEIIW